MVALQTDFTVNAVNGVGELLVLQSSLLEIEFHLSIRVARYAAVFVASAMQGDYGSVSYIILLAQLILGITKKL